MFQVIEEEFDKVVDKLYGWLQTFIVMLPNIVLAIIIVIASYFIAKFIRNLLSKGIRRFSKNNAINNFLSSITFVFILFLGVFFALGVLQLDKTVTSLLAGVGIVGLALGFAFKDIASNFLAGIYLAVKSPINEGDLIKYEDYLGTVKHIGIRAVTLQTLQGQDVVIPNRFIIDNPYMHYTINGIRRIDLDIGISYGDDLEKAEQVTLQTIKTIDYLNHDKPIDMYYKEFGESSINFTIRYWVNYQKQTDYLRALSDGIKRIKKAYEENDITITFPIRTLDFDMKGGKTLSEMLVESHNDNSNGNSPKK